MGTVSSGIRSPPSLGLVCLPEVGALQRWVVLQLRGRPCMCKVRLVCEGASRRSLCHGLGRRVNNLTYMDPPALSRALERHNTFRDRCSHISDLSVKVSSPFGP